MKLTVDPNLCVGSGNCEAICPQLFKVVDGISQVQVGTVPEEEESCAQEAVEGCPVGAISTS
jgi:ferredoxin